METNSSYIGTRIKELREINHLTQDQLATMSGVSYSTLTKIETGVIKSPRVEILQQLCKALEISLDKLLNPKDEQGNTQ